MKQKTRMIAIGIVSSFIIFSFICWIGSHIQDYLIDYRQNNFKNLGITFGTTKSLSCSKGGCFIKYVYQVRGQLYGGSAGNGNSFFYPDKQYYVVYSKDDPTLQIILPDYSISETINPDTLSNNYIRERLKYYARTQKKEDWGIFWQDIFEK